MVLIETVDCLDGIDAEKVFVARVGGVSIE